MSDICFLRKKYLRIKHNSLTNFYNEKPKYDLLTQVVINQIKNVYTHIRSSFISFEIRDSS